VTGPGPAHPHSIHNVAVVEAAGASGGRLSAGSTAQDVPALDLSPVNPAYAIASVAVDLRIHEVVDVPNRVVGAFLTEAILHGGSTQQ
jgi:hypothetical protein